MGAKVLMVGFDGLDPRTIDAMIRAGEMPVLARLKAASRAATIENYPGLGAGTFWPSAATGALPGEHGRSFRVQFDPASYEVAFRDDAADFDIGAFWHALDDEGLKTCVIDWSHGPVRALRHGLFVDAWLAHEPSNAFACLPAEAAREIEREFGLDPWNGSLSAALPRTGEEWRQASETAVARIRTKTRYCLKKLRETDWDLFAPTFSEAHDIGHYALHLVDRAHHSFDAAAAAAAGDPMLAACRAFDEAAAALIEAAGEDAVVVVIGGPGMTEQISGNAAMDAICRRLDLGWSEQAASQERAQAAYRKAAPLALRKFLSPIVRRLVGRPPALPEMATRRFFPVPNTDNAGAIRVNLKGREAHGTVDPADYDALLEEIARGLREIVDAQSGASIVEDVVFARREFPGRRAENLPDIFVVWRREQPFEKIRSDRIGLIDTVSLARRGDHTPYGFFWAKGADRAFADVIRPHEAAPVVAGAARAPLRKNAAEPFAAGPVS